MNDPAPALTSAPPPPLATGQRLTREEFERRYDSMPDLKKAELIEGVVYVGSPVRTEQHGEPHLVLGTWLGLYRMHTPGVRCADNSTVRLDDSNDPQPDLFLMIEDLLGGQARIDEDGYLQGAPELASEVAASSVDRDLGPRRESYRRNGVKEYIVWRVEEEAIDWFVLRDGDYAPLPMIEGTYHSEVFPGLWLDPAALLREDFPRLLAVLQQGLASPEHAAFVFRLQSAASGNQA